MGSRPLAPLLTGPRVRRPVRPAVIVSVVVHATLALILMRQQRPAPATQSVAIEVDLTADTTALGATTPVGGPGVEESGQPSPPKASHARERHGAKASKIGEARGDAEPTPAGQDEAQGVVVKAPAGPADPRDSNERFTSFRSRNPDLSRGPDLREPEAKRDLLAAPRVPDKAPGDLPQLLRGPGGVMAKIDDDGQIHFHDPKAVTANLNPAMGLDLSGRFDLNDQLMRLAGQDPYASTKRKMAEETREQRLCMARRAQHTRESQALFELSTNIRAIAGRTDWPPEKRRRAIFDIWDECDDGASDYAALARATITAVIRQAFPQGTPLAYPPQELLALNSQRTSPLEFAPYLASPGRRPSARSEDCPRPDAGPAIE
jgi:hypothetical protein